jgi:hypothetical protein
MKAILFALFVLFSLSIWGASLTVDNNTPSAGQYATIQAAHDAAINGDTIYVLPSNTPYAGFTVTKQLTILGGGWAPVNQDNYRIKVTYIGGTMTFDTGSDNALMQGFGGQFNAYIMSSGVNISNCKVSYLTINGSNVSVDKCEIYFSIGILGSNTTIKRSTFRLDWGQPCRILSSNATIINNIIVGGPLGIQSANDTSVITNNTFAITTNGQVCTGSNFFFTNNLIYNCNDPTVSTINQAFNVFTMDAAEFVDCVGEDYHLSPTSSAVNAGNPDIGFNDVDGSRNDCGAYGGPDPFIEGGVVSPYIYEINANPVNTQSQDWQVQIKAKINQE